MMGIRSERRRKLLRGGLGALIAFPFVAKAITWWQGNGRASDAHALVRGSARTNDTRTKTATAATNATRSSSQSTSPQSHPATSHPATSQSPGKGPSEMTKRIARILKPEEHHWVGDGFYVSTIFSPFQVDAQVISPFLLMDHAAPRAFEPSAHKRGVGEHPHRGFETVTFAYSGEIEHRDSHGGGGRIGPGDVQWMTAGRGVVHEEKHSQAFSERGGVFEMVQLWVNLPAEKKMTEPRYQHLLDATFPRVVREDATLRLVAGTLGDARGPALTHTPMTVFDMHFANAGASQFGAPVGQTTLVFVLSGLVRVQQAQNVSPRHLVIMERADEGEVHIEALEKDTRLLVLQGKPLDEPVIAHGPFVMNTKQEIVQAMQDYQNGRMGHL